MADFSEDAAFIRSTIDSARKTGKPVIWPKKITPKGDTLWDTLKPWWK